MLLFHACLLKWTMSSLPLFMNSFAFKALVWYPWSNSSLSYLRNNTKNVSKKHERFSTPTLTQDVFFNYMYKVWNLILKKPLQAFLKPTSSIVNLWSWFLFSRRGWQLHHKFASFMGSFQIHAKYVISYVHIV
jgi:hypothetical protein